MSPVPVAKTLSESLPRLALTDERMPGVQNAKA